MTAAAATALVPRSTRASVEFARTLDGWDLALHHYPGTPAGIDALPPVILCPGYACNHVFMDFNERYSLARFLARRGFDAWVLDLRGHGYSEPAGERRADWTFDDLVELDLPAAVSAVRARSGRRPVWIGHSMGGILMYAALGHRRGAAGIDRRAGDAGVAGRLSAGGLAAAARPRPAPRTLPVPQQLPQRGALVALWSAAQLVARRARRRHEPGEHRPACLRSRHCGACISNVPRRVLRQLADWSLSGELRSCDHRIDYRANLSRITTPALIIAGAADRLAPPEIVRFAYDRIGSTAQAVSRVRHRATATAPTTATSI